MPYEKDFGFLFGCGKGTENTSGETAQADGLTVVTSFYPVYLLAANVTDGVEGVTLKKYDTASDRLPPRLRIDNRRYENTGRCRCAVHQRSGHGKLYG